MANSVRFGRKSAHKARTAIVIVFVFVVAIIAAVYAEAQALINVQVDASATLVELWPEEEIPYYAPEDQALLRSCYEALGIQDRLLYSRLFKSNLKQKPTLQVDYALAAGERRPAVIICPGGGYITKAVEKEGAEIARWLNSIGISAFILNYRIAPYGYPVQLADAERAIRYLRYHADEYQIDPDQIGIIGFSAGGHLASTLGTHDTPENPMAKDPIDRISSRPDFLILAYSVITMGEYAHYRSKAVCLGPEPTEEMIELLSSEKNVTADTPPVFIWSTADDMDVSVQNTYLFASALEEKKVSYEMHIFPSGKHGLGLAQDHPVVCEWPALCEKWLQSIGVIAG